ncbi:hypothetical protein C8A00DRAFT_34910 [Chaetomidium leptoderma]|uniref:Uncharacterized protein n=1 Tax=Chaetomidium leptoderma TaxID=669021 RepID=A0AAN6VIX0_9PEZI|nr:hypothetical protein C8A00DRAFT_34910 [Chaetomidium leptoderma]
MESQQSAPEESSALPTVEQSDKPKSLGTIQDAVRRKVQQLGQIKRGRECTQELDVLMDQLRDLLPDEHPESRQGRRDPAQVKAFWGHVRAQLSIKDEEIHEPWLIKDVKEEGE